MVLSATVLMLCDFYNNTAGFKRFLIQDRVAS